jgi:hypothetical protein
MSSFQLIISIKHAVQIEESTWFLLSSMFILWALHVEFYITHIILKEMIALVKKNYLFCYYHDKEWMNWPAHTHFYLFLTIFFIFSTSKLENFGNFYIHLFFMLSQSKEACTFPLQKIEWFVWNLKPIQNRWSLN